MSDNGRPSNYLPEFAEQAAKFCQLGATDDELATFFSVHRSTIYRWKLDHQAFCDAIKAGKEIADERVERSLYQKATGYNYVEQQAIKVKTGQHEESVEIVEVERHAPAETVAAIFWLKNRRSKVWRDKQEIDFGALGDLAEPELRELVVAIRSAKAGRVGATSVEGTTEKTRH